MHELLTVGRREWRIVLAVLAAAASLGLLAGAVFDGGGTRTVTVRAAAVGAVIERGRSAVASAPKGISPQPKGDSGSIADVRVQNWQQPLQATLTQGVSAAEQYGGTAAAAIWVQGWDKPLAAGLAGKVARMWSMSKPVAAIAVLTRLEQLNAPTPPGLISEIHWAITASDDCAVRGIILELQHVAGSDATASAEFNQVLSQAGINRNQTVPAGNDDGTACDNLEARWNAPDPTAPDLFFGTHTWTITDAASFAHALITGVYGSSGELVARQMRLPKRPAILATPEDYTSPLDEPPSGGNVFPPSWHPGYKGGWGGHEQGDFLAGQMVILNIDGVRIGLAAEFWPSQQPPSDDPGTTNARQALDALFTDVRDELQALEARR